jgi:alpha-beta hydrolase superfamily lysophospholipase
MRELARQGVTALSIDWDGHGAGGSSLLDYPLLGESLERALAAIAAETAYAPIALIGHSTGALVAALYRERELRRESQGSPPPLARRYFLVSPALGLAPASGRARELLHLLDPSFVLGSFPEAVRTYGPRGALPAVGRFRRAEFPVRLAHPERGNAAVQLDRFIRAWSPAPPPALDAASCDLYAGGRDAIVDLAAAERWLPRWFAEVRVHRYPAFGHWGMAFSPALARTLAADVAARLGSRAASR